MIDHTGLNVSVYARSKAFCLKALPNYYGAFVLDPDGHNIEAVCHEPG
jgi:catechol 2,3-dioxygenase-like lactoylglutathione lyase family enzyme